MTRAVLAALLVATAAPALAFDLPHLTFPPPPSTASSSTGR